MKEKFYYKVWSELDGKFVKSPTKTNFLYQSEKACREVINNEVFYNGTRTIDDYEIKKYRLIEVIE